MSVVNAGLMLSAPSGYTIDRSLRFRSSASAYLSRTPASAGNRKTWTWSGWVKRGALGVLQTLFSAYNSNTDSGYTEIRFLSADTLVLSGYATNWRITTQVFRDSSAWYHIVVSLDTTNATAANRIKIYLNGSEITAFGTSNNPALNDDFAINLNAAHSIGRVQATATQYFDGYMTEVNFIDGQALDPTYFGEYNEDTGVWQPIKYTGTYGTNGFYLKFSDNSTTTTLGYDYSGNSNNFTANNVSVTSGATYDSMTDVPTLTSEDAANYAVMNPLAKDGGTTLSDANLKISSVNYGNNTATMFLTNGKWYWEAQGDGYVGAVCGQEGQNWSTSLSATGSKSIGYYINGTVYWDGGNNGGGLSTYGTSDVIGVAVDMAAGTVAFYKNGSLEYTATFGSGTVPDLSAGVFPCYNNGSSSSTAKVVTFNFGQRPFAYTPPAGFKSLNTYNLPDSTIEDGSAYFNTVTYAGTGSSLSIPVGFIPDFTWIKRRNASNNHQAFDVLRGSNVLVPNETGAESDYSLYFDFSSSDGFDLPNASVNMNNSSGTYVAWNWKANGSGVSNTDGSITSTVSANTTAGFSISTFTTPSSFTNATVGHGLGVAPSMLIVRRRTTGDWITWHQSLGANGYLTLNTTSASASNSGSFNGTSSTTWTMGSSAWWQASASDWICYAFAEVEGYSKFGSYTGNGSTNGAFVYLGFRPRLILIKRTNSTGNWQMWELNPVGTYNVVNNLLYANLANAETSASATGDALSNGFKLRQPDNDNNASGGTYIYMAFAENPFKNSLAR